MADDEQITITRVLTYAGDKQAILRDLRQRRQTAQHGRRGAGESESGEYVITESFKDSDEVLKMLGEEVDPKGVARKSEHS